MNERSTKRTIERGHSYQLTDFRRVVGFGRDAMRSAIAKGLVVRKVGRRRFISGDDWLTFLANQPAAFA